MGCSFFSHKEEFIIGYPNVQSISQIQSILNKLSLLSVNLLQSEDIYTKLRIENLYVFLVIV
ncbi:hypothetical protein HMPREF0765_0864 [Sphingobacterium spiritivorum ATCC 33300]|uniref:Uncharacterized protein n=1 Tax=Sphingobacterium spiritivorum ATCC 33300 TaxID=525372 RepID=C2FU58_SPHSI|nr:hypothetical protein HMPREF0765_0864 [Sphingobacterium spiritivorum ATCC 33300]